MGSQALGNEMDLPINMIVMILGEESPKDSNHEALIRPEMQKDYEERGWRKANDQERVLYFARKTDQRPLYIFLETGTKKMVSSQSASKFAHDPQWRKASHEERDSFMRTNQYQPKKRKTKKDKKD